MTFEHLPKYKCHKVVRALKIKSMINKGNLNSEHTSTVIVPEDENYSRFEVIDYADKVKSDGKDAGYFVQYEDGYISWSPTKAFEEGYTKIEEPQLTEAENQFQIKTNVHSLSFADPKDEALKKDFRDIINKHSRENLSNTPDFLLADYLITCLKNFESIMLMKDVNAKHAEITKRMFYGEKGMPKDI